MDAQKPTLPNLLDIAIPTPSYQPEPSNRRPATTSNSTRQGITFDGANFPVSSKAYQWGQTSSSFRPGQVILEQKGEDDGPMFSFSPFRTPFKALPKLYTTHQHETMSQKFKNLKQRYQKLYKKIEGMEEGHGQGLTDENLKEIYLEAEKMFSKTYSVKYFGVQGEELGIASKRLPMTQGNGQAKKNVLKKENSLQENISRQGLHSRNVSEAGKRALQVRKNMYPAAVNNNKGNDFVMENGENEEVKVKSSPGSSPSGMSPANTQTQFRSYKPNARAQSQPYATEKKSPVNNDKDENEEEDLDKYVDEELASTHAVKGSSMTGRLLSSQGGFRNNKEFGMNNNKTNSNNLIGVQNDAYVVTKYLIPKKLQTVKKTKNSSIAAMSQTHRIFGTKIEAAEKGPQKNFHSNASTHRVAQEQVEEERGWPKLNTNNQGNQVKLKKASSLDKKVASMEKVKRSLLRNVHVEKAWEARPYKDELDIPERFRTYEVKKVMADSAKYSYAKLLETMNTKDRPETALIGTTEKMERILSVRDEKRKFLESKSGKRAENYGDVDKRDVHGNYVVKVWYPKENEMFNRFWKIKHGVVNEQEEENQVVTQE